MKSHNYDKVEMLKYSHDYEIKSKQVYKKIEMIRLKTTEN